MWLLLTALIVSSTQATKLALSYLWHLQQPIYWPAPSHYNNLTYQFAYESIQMKGSQGGHPENNLGEIFGKDDRKAIYQYRAADSINSVYNAPDFGVQITYPGDLIENVNSLASHNSYGYYGGWNNKYSQARQEKTSGGFTKLDIVGFPYHHALGPLVHKKAFDMEIAIQKIVSEKTWGSGVSKGFFPAEMAFSETLIPSLVEAGYEWVIVPNNHISRACENYQYSKYGDNNTPPNKADQINPPQDNWFKMQVSRGCAPNNAYPYSFRPHYAKYVDPESGKEHKIIVVPSAMAMSWMDGYECYSTNDMNQISGAGDPQHPILVILAHDGDNAFGGGYSYYMECVKNLVGQAVQQGYEPTSIQQYLHDYPVDENDVVHVEDGAWINASGDFGDPTFVNWNWPLFAENGSFNVTDGWSDKQRHYAITTAIENWVETAEAVSGGVRKEQVQSPQSDATPAEVAWHHYLPALTSGYLYYGTGTLDMCLKSTIAGNSAIWWAKQALKGSYQDTTAPSVWRPYRLPYNPGSYQYGSLTHYQWQMQSTDFYVYTFVFDVSGVKRVQLFVREDKDGVNPLDENYNEVYTCNNNYVSNWVTFDMVKREFPKGNFYNWKGNCFQGLTDLPESIGDEYYFQVKGYRKVLLDYYIEAEDIHGNVMKTDIFHVWVGNQQFLETN